ncbi:mechanosensitive ion channel family protein [Aquabacterium sp. A7-Y]|uniref:mechanosensitive ion channel family protein n=1 Tax=Aquabacterium sp. A7-Y TaxID=1349605 RepID=UPI00223CB630|nr:mechanosensitive ion channel family protein [Aquabacterium sp. A7-Y]MCW7539183.1 mechanosensitive ion channel family protein [Aquabacterium sp. A7-Y]
MDAHLLTAWLTQTTLLGITLANWALVIGATVVSYLAMMTALRLARRHAETLQQQDSQHVGGLLVDLLSRTNRGLVALVAVLIGVGLLDLPERWSERVGHLWFIALALQFALWANRLVSLALSRYIERHASSGMTQVGASATLMSWGLRTLLWTVVLLAMLSNMGVNITAFVASLGVGGIAVALAVQNILGDLFASLSIAVDKPFEVGDFIVVGGVSGSVEHVGVKSTRIRALSGEQVVMSNTDLLKQTVSNYKRLAERRIAFKFGVTYDTSPEQAEAIPALVRRIIQGKPQLRFDRAHLQGFGESSLDYEVIYIVLDPSYNLYMDLQQSINLELMRGLKEMGVDFAFPTRTVVLAGDAAAAARAVRRDGQEAGLKPRPNGREGSLQ